MTFRQVLPSSAYTLLPGEIALSCTVRTRRSAPRPSGSYAPSRTPVSNPEW